MLPETTHHACALEINKTGMIIKGCSGSGKTSLMMGLLEKAKQENLEAFLVSDDRVHLTPASNKLIAKTPPPIEGLVEIRGYGIISHPYQDTTTVSLVIELVEDDQLSRMPEAMYNDFSGLSLPLLQVPERHESQAIRIVFAWLEENACLQV